MFPDVTVNGMTLLVVIIVELFMLNSGLAVFEPQGVKCGQKQCNISEYCSPYDTHCRPCSEACNVTSRNYQPEECAKDCQVYLQDQRYVLRTDARQYDDLSEEVERLRVMFAVLTTLTCLSLLAILYLLGRTLIRWEKIQKALRTAFTKSWIKKTNKNKVQDDVEAGVAKESNLKLTMSTISAAVESSRSNGNNNDTSNTTTTSLSRRHPSEDTTLDYAYDNPAMTPSPEAAQLRPKRESSF